MDQAPQPHRNGLDHGGPEQQNKRAQAKQRYRGNQMGRLRSRGGGGEIGSCVHLAIAINRDGGIETGT